MLSFSTGGKGMSVLVIPLSIPNYLNHQQFKESWGGLNLLVESFPPDLLGFIKIFHEWL